MAKLQARDEMVINAPVEILWTLITDINYLPKINPGLISATGTMDTLHATRQCVVMNRGKQGNITEKLIELVPRERTVWTIVSDDMGFGKMLKEIRFCIHLEKIGDRQTKVINETWYQPANFMARVMNVLMMKKMIAKAQAQILVNLKKLSEN